MDSLVIPASKRKAATLIGGGIVMLCACTLLLVIPEQEVGVRARMAAWIGVPFFVLLAGYGLVLFFSTKPLLVIDDRGVLDNASAAAVGLIPWNEITGIKLYELQSQRFLAIHLADTDKYLNRAGLLRRLLIRGNRSVSGSIVNIPQIALPFPLEQVLDRIHRHIVATRYAKAD